MRPVGPDSVLALDIGGTEMVAGVVSPDGRVIGEARTPTPSGARSEELFDCATFVCQAALSDAAGVTVAGLGVGCGGPMKWPSGDVSPLNIPGWRDFPLRDRLTDYFGLPTRLHNDAVCLTIGEHFIGAGRGYADMMGMVVSTGVGGGLILDGRLIDGASGNAGHVGHVVVDADGPVCECGGRGCLEAVARGPALVAWAKTQGWRADDAATGEALARSARAGDETAIRAFERCGRAVGVAIASVAALCDLRVVVVGGGVARAGDLVMDSVYEAFDEHSGLEFARRCRVVLAGTRSGLVGAAALFLAGGGYWHGDPAPG